jgi:hypothetical protein
VTECHKVLVSLTKEKNDELEKSKELVELESKDLVKSVEDLLNHGRELLDEKRRQQASSPFPRLLSP